MWNKEGEENPSKSGIIPLKIDLVRKLPGRDQGRNLSGRDEEEVVPGGSRGQEEGRKHQEQLTGSHKTPPISGIFEKLTDTKSWEGSKEQEEGSKSNHGGKEPKEAEKP